MFSRIRRSGFAIVAVIAMLAMAGPTAAFNHIQRTGVIGSYDIHDGNGLTGAVCFYRPGSDQLDELFNIQVSAPLLQAVAGMGNEKVGWNFSIQRKIRGEAWTTRYTSRTVTKVSNSSEWVTFTNMGVRVIPPFASSGPSTIYRAILRMFWYDGTSSRVIGSVSGRIEYYVRHFYTDTSSARGPCPAYDLA